MINRYRTLTLLTSIGAVLALTATAALAAEPRDTSNNCDAEHDAGFEDVPESNVHLPMINCVDQHALTVGKTETTYDPGGFLRKAQLATFLVRLIDQAEDPDDPNSEREWQWDGETDYFDDDDGSPHEDNINKLAAEGIIPSGEDHPTFSPQAIPTRALMAEFTAAALGSDGTNSLPPGTLEDCFEDDEDHEAEGDINLLAGAGVITGRTETEFAPDLTLRRDQMATFLARAYDLAVDGPPDNFGYCSGRSGGGDELL